MSGVLVATADGRLSRYFYGVEYSPKELRMALVESGDGKVGSLVDTLLLYCYHYNPAAGRYGAPACYGAPDQAHGGLACRCEPRRPGRCR